MPGKTVNKPNKDIKGYFTLKNRIFFGLSDIIGKKKEFKPISAERLKEILEKPHTIEREEMNTLNLFFAIYKLQRTNLIEEELASGRKPGELVSNLINHAKRVTESIFKYEDKLRRSRRNTIFSNWNRATGLGDVEDILKRMVGVVTPDENGKFKEPITSPIGLDIFLMSLREYQKEYEKRHHG